MSFKPKIADPAELKWPCIESNNEETVLTTLASVFSKYKSCLRTIKKAPKWKKVAAENEDRLSEEEETQRKIFKSWFVVGVQSVMKKLERNSLSAVLLWRDMQPAVLRKALLQLIYQHGCPAVCVTDLLSTLQQSWPGLTSASVLGILKTEETNDFDKLESIIRTHAPKVADSSKQVDKLIEQSPAVSTYSVEKSQIQTASFELRSKTEGCSEKVCRPKVDAKKYYVYKSEDNQSKSFSGQSFIAFDEGPPCPIVETVKGERVQKRTRQRENMNSFGIRPSLAGMFTSNNSSATLTDGNKNGYDGIGNSKKRKQMESENNIESGYKRINVKKMQKNVQKNKKIKKKKKKK